MAASVMDADALVNVGAIALPDANTRRPLQGSRRWIVRRPQTRRQAPNKKARLLPNGLSFAASWAVFFGCASKI
jgi:hypothetical protein